MEGSVWWCHSYCLPEIDDSHIQCVYLGTNDHGNFVFKAKGDCCNTMLKFDEDEMPKLVFKDRMTEIG
jgi:hypothetical protein